MSKVSFLVLFCTPFVFACILYTPFVPPLYFVCTPFVPLGMLAPSGCCTPFVLLCIRVCSVCTFLYRSGFRFPKVVVLRLYPFVLTPFGEYNTIRRREEYKSTKVCKCAPSIVLGARWPNGITAARAVAAAPAGCSVMPIAALGRLYDPNSGINGKHVFPILLGKPHREQSNCETREARPQCGLRRAGTPPLQAATISLVIELLKARGLKHR